MEHRFYLAVTTAALFPGAILAQEPISPSTFHEERLERAKVSGSLVVGAMYSLDRLALAEPLLEIALSAAGTTATTACLRVTSRDGTYEAVGAYPLPAAPAGALTLNFPTDYIDLLRQIPAAARINLGTCDQDEPVVPVNWPEAPAAEPQKLMLFVNTAGADTVIAYETPTGEVVTRCQQINETNGIKYTAICPVDVDRLPHDGPATLYFDVTRNRVVETYEVQVLLAAD